MYEPTVKLPDELFQTTPFSEYIRKTCGDLPSQSLEEYVRDLEDDDVPE